MKLFQKEILDINKISYERLLEWYVKHIDPTDTQGQFFDKGSQYRTAIFYLNEVLKIFIKPVLLDFSYTIVAQEEKIFSKKYGAITKDLDFFLKGELTGLAIKSLLKKN